jgi:hypothetical protein
MNSFTNYSDLMESKLKAAYADTGELYNPKVITSSMIENFQLMEDEKIQYACSTDIADKEGDTIITRYITRGDFIVILTDEAKQP